MVRGSSRIITPLLAECSLDLTYRLLWGLHRTSTGASGKGPAGLRLRWSGELPGSSLRGSSLGDRLPHLYWQQAELSTDGACRIMTMMMMMMCVDAGGSVGRSERAVVVEEAIQRLDR